MDSLRKLGLVVCTGLLALLVFGAVVVLSLDLTFRNPDRLKAWLSDSQLYAAVPQAIIESSSNDTAQNPNSSDLQRPEVQTALKTALTPAFLQQSVNSVIDGSYSWLEGQSPKPTYSIDLTPVKQAFADSLASQARARLATLPPCTSLNVNSTDPFVIDCRPPTAISEAAIQQQVNQLMDGKIFSDNVINADTTSLGTDVQTDEANTGTVPGAPVESVPVEPWYQKAEGLPRLYRWINQAPWLMAGLAVLLGVAVVFLARTRRSGFKILSIVALAIGGWLSMVAASTLVGFNQIGNNIGQSGNLASSLQAPILSLVQAIGKSLSYPQLWSGLALVFVGIIGLVILHTTRPQASTPAKAKPTPKKSAL